MTRKSNAQRKRNRRRRRKSSPAATLVQTPRLQPAGDEDFLAELAFELTGNKDILQDDALRRKAAPLAITEVEATEDCQHGSVQHRSLQAQRCERGFPSMQCAEHSKQSFVGIVIPQKKALFFSSKNKEPCTFWLFVRQGASTWMLNPSHDRPPADELAAQMSAQHSEVAVMSRTYDDESQQPKTYALLLADHDARQPVVLVPLWKEVFSRVVAENQHKKCKEDWCGAHLHRTMIMYSEHYDQDLCIHVYPHAHVMSCELSQLTFREDEEVTRKRGVLIDIRSCRILCGWNECTLMHYGERTELFHTQFNEAFPLLVLEILGEVCCIGSSVLPVDLRLEMNSRARIESAMRHSLYRTALAESMAEDSMSELRNLQTECEEVTQSVGNVREGLLAALREVNLLRKGVRRQELALEKERGLLLALQQQTHPTCFICLCQMCLCTERCVLPTDDGEPEEALTPVVFPNCGHVCCEECAVRIMQSYNRKCPICRAKASRVQQVRFN